MLIRNETGGQFDPNRDATLDTYTDPTHARRLEAKQESSGIHQDCWIISLNLNEVMIVLVRKWPDSAPRCSHPFKDGRNIGCQSLLTLRLDSRIHELCYRTNSRLEINFPEFMWNDTSRQWNSVVVWRRWRPMPSSESLDYYVKYQPAMGGHSTSNGSRGSSQCIYWYDILCTLRRFWYCGRKVYRCGACSRLR